MIEFTESHTSSYLKQKALYFLKMYYVFRNYLIILILSVLEVLNKYDIKQILTITTDN
jgi:hypothetical protein